MQLVIPKNASEDKGNSRKHIGHGNGKGCCCVLHPQKIQILVNNWPATNQKIEVTITCFH